jgi:beta-N-acetylhexosaminidase
MFPVRNCEVYARMTDRPTPDRAHWAEDTLRRLSLRQKVGQLVMPCMGSAYRAAGTPGSELLRHWVADLQVGGVIAGMAPPLETAAMLNLLQSSAALPLLVGADMEHGPGQVLRGGTVLPHGLENGGATRFPPPMALGAAGDDRLAYELGRVTAIEARAAGIHIAFAPVVDVNSNPANPIINTRSYGADPDLVARMAVAHIHGLQQHGMLATAKHFPGHGDTRIDSHLELPRIDADRARLDAVDLPPFRAAVAAGVGCVMAGHIAFPSLTGDSVPATLNGALITGILRRELGFDGIVFTDALDMAAIVRHYSTGAAAVMALDAGVDVLLQMPGADVAAVIDAVVEAVQRGTLTGARIDESALRVLLAKQRLGLHAGTTVDLDAILHVVGRSEHHELAAESARRSITIVRDEAALLPLRAGRVLCIVYADIRDPFAGREFEQELAAGGCQLETVRIDVRTDGGALAALARLADSADLVVFAPFIGAFAGNGGIAVADHIADTVRDIAARRPTVLTSFGTPYVLQQFPDIGTSVLAWAQWEPAQRAAARALTGDVAVEGRLPVPLPPLHGIGYGIMRHPVDA